MFGSLFGKYRFLVISIALFLIFDLGVLVLNFYTSGKIAEQTELINSAARQRTLTQQMSKATLYIKSQKLQLWVYQSGLDELRDHYQTFGANLEAFNRGGTIVSPSTSLPISISAVSDPEGVAILSRANSLWSEFETAIDPLMVDTLVSDDEIRPASSFIAANNLKMFALMDELTEFFKATSERQTNFLRAAQVVGITLATINFFIILFHFLGQLRVRDQEIQLKQHESDQILSTINEGVFLLDQDMMMSGQHSKQLQKIFLTRKVSGRKFERFLTRYFPQKTVSTALDFAKLYFRDHIDTALIEDVNPLKRVEAIITKKDGESETKYLDFSFALLNQDDSRHVVLVTVRDVTSQIRLEVQDRLNADELEQQMMLLTQILPIHQSDLAAFIEDSRAGLDRINLLLKGTKQANDDYEITLTRIARETHKLKGNASVLNFEMIAQGHHKFENTLEEISRQSKRRALTGRDFLPLTMQLKQSFASLDLINDVRDKLGDYVNTSLNQGEWAAQANSLELSTNESFNEIAQQNPKWFELLAYTQKLAAQKGIAARLNLRGLNVPLNAHLSSELYSIAVQLLHNSLAHGLESERERLELKKPSLGEISVSISHDKQGNYRFLFEDDGRGFNYERIRAELIERGVLDASEAKILGNTALVRYAFKDAISTQDNVDQTAGRGIGLALVWQQVKALNAKLKIRSVSNEFTQFIIDFSFTPNKAGSKISDVPSEAVRLVS